MFISARPTGAIQNEITETMSTELTDGGVVSKDEKWDFGIIRECLENINNKNKKQVTCNEQSNRLVQHKEHITLTSSSWKW